MMLKRRQRPRSGIVRNPDRIRSPAHRAWVRLHTCICAINGLGCGGEVECAHVRDGTDGGASIKPSDIWCVPLCRDHHRRQHAVGEAAFSAEHKLNLIAVAQQFAARSPALRKLARTQQEAPNGQV